jgi:hypothetical protein
MIHQMMDKKRGVTTGFPDIMIIDVDYDYDYNRVNSLIFLEVKALGGKLTEKQEALHKELREEGHHVTVVYSVDDVKKCLKDLGVI